MFEAWLRGLDRESHASPIMSGQIGDFPLDAIKDLKVENRADPTKPGQAVEGPEVVEGRIGKALKLSGENNVTLPLGNFDRYRAVLDRRSGSRRPTTRTARSSSIARGPGPTPAAGGTSS